jgi:hypothetical protein
MMTRKDFEAIAHILDANVADIGIVLDFTDLLEETNPRFDRARFIDASTIKLRDSWSRGPRMMANAKKPRR